MCNLGAWEFLQCPSLHMIINSAQFRYSEGKWNTSHWLRYNAFCPFLENISKREGMTISMKDNMVQEITKIRFWIILNPFYILFISLLGRAGSRGITLPMSSYRGHRVSLWFNLLFTMIWRQLCSCCERFLLSVRGRWRRLPVGVLVLRGAATLAIPARPRLWWSPGCRLLSEANPEKMGNKTFHDYIIHDKQDYIPITNP